MRNINFRGKYNGVTRHWVYGSLLIKEGSYFIVSKHGIGGIHESYSVIPETVGQYIGSKDKNGIEIYEGDIVLYNVCTLEPIIVKGVIEFKDGNFIFNSDGHCVTLHTNYTNDKREVVGSIHD